MIHGSRQRTVGANNKGPCVHSGSSPLTSTSVSTTEWPWPWSPFARPIRAITCATLFPEVTLQSGRADASAVLAILSPNFQCLANFGIDF
ncbi:hypothetical protein CDAR_262841 [Caerostris darwini]|uniref:Uncharacterized protein n=1 Tax=Caerostris darwini TaxID=1538125 RepID=A0AAV4RW37_9ARAC|nr:hypothetical protein CDAR_262841 [Caerostris darwini]